jgi:ATP-dependent DNA ligase
MTKSKTSLSRSTAPMEALSVTALPKGKQWRYEPKWDGFRCLAHKQDGKIELVSKSGRPLNRYFPDIVALLEQVKAPQFVLDGELVIERDEGYSFGDLQLRLHPAASRVAKLVKESHATFVVFDLLVDDKGVSLVDETFTERRERLEQFYAKYLKRNFLVLSPQTASMKTANSWLKSYKKHIDGIVAKNSEETYQPGERIMQKFKQLKTADCVVGGFRYGTNSSTVASLLLGLYDAAGKLHHVGFTSSLKDIDKAALTKKLEKLITPPGFTGNAPGGPSRWSTERSGDWHPLKPELVVEVKYDHVSDGRFRHGTKFLRWRPDKAPRQCTMEQIAR